HVGIHKGGYSAPWEVLEAKKANLPDAEMKAQYAIDSEVIDAYQKIHDAICEDVPPVPEAIPIGGVAPPAEPAAMDPAQATECRGRDVYEKWTDMAAAYCGPNARGLARTRTVSKDARSRGLRPPELPRRRRRADQGRDAPQIPARRGRSRLERPAHRRSDGDGQEVQGRVHAVEVRQVPRAGIHAGGGAALVEGQE